MKKVMVCLLLCLLLLGAFFLGKGFGTADRALPAVEGTPVRDLHLSATTDKEVGFTTIPLEQGNYREITYLNVKNVTIGVDGISMKLEDALLEGYLSVDELIASARKDAGNGLCGESAKSENGLTEFRYHYPEFTLQYIYDLYETPDGRQHLIADCLIYGIGSDPHYLPDADVKTGIPIDYEDWGLNFEISHLDASGITLKCSQSGGQQIGVLNAEGIALYRKDPETGELEYVEPLDEDGDLAVFAGGKNWEPDPDAFLTMGGTKELSFDFARQYGKLPAGEYEMSLHIVDCYNQETVHPLTRNYYDMQWYGVEFTIASNSQPLSYSVYVPNDNVDGFDTEVITAEDISADAVLTELKKRNVLPDVVSINGFGVDNGMVTIDFNRAFADVVCSMGTSGELMIVGSVVNTFLDAFQAESLYFTVDGQVLESGHTIYDFVLTFFPLDPQPAN